MAREWWREFNKYANFLKHAKDDPEGVLDGVDERVNDIVIYFACTYYHELGYQMSPEMTALVNWVELIYPHLLVDGLRKNLAESPKYAHFRNRPRLDQLKVGRLMLSQMQQA